MIKFCFNLSLSFTNRVKNYNPNSAFIQTQTHAYTNSHSVHSAISVPSTSRVWMIPSRLFPLLTAFTQQLWSPSVKCVSVPSSTNSPAVSMFCPLHQTSIVSFSDRKKANTEWKNCKVKKKYLVIPIVRSSAQKQEQCPAWLVCDWFLKSFGGSAWSSQNQRKENLLIVNILFYKGKVL